MIDRTTFDLCIAEHATGVAQINGAAWRREGEARRSIRAMAAIALVALVTLLDAAASPTRQRDTALMSTKPA
ncbi:MAG: hypothetical protein AVDCRST_MAG40-1968 [uncultured Gemmatimonadaceae bacterium]|uniref:Uncharacterized protein n=1 Tax=uncultured Gemmatimonadaceae bacterium TaxID=246130 RepID=A0A6J4LGP1_9BACT|nr:MAG: hypothetical protein AVDCRST_MAG40-1968 [uncultured Gemmatimonadaceae bacterium]